MNDITVQCESEFGTQQIITFSTGLFTPVEMIESNVAIINFYKEEKK